MANLLCQSFRRLNISKTSFSVSKYSTAFHQNSNKNHFPPLLHEPTTKLSIYEPNLRLAPLPLHNIDLGISQRIIQKIIDNPVSINPRPISDPENVPNQPKVDQTPEKSLDLPTPGQKVEKQAKKKGDVNHRMIKIRQRKMKIHKKKKWLRKNKVFYEKQQQVLYYNSEIAFRAEIQEKIDEADNFDAKAYVASRLEILDTVRLPTKLRGTPLPSAQILKILQEEDMKRNRKKYEPEITL